MMTQYANLLINKKGYKIFIQLQFIIYDDTVNVSMKQYIEREIQI